MKCSNPNCSLEFTPTGRQKYCCYECGDLIRSKKYRDSHVLILRERRDKEYPLKKDVFRARHQAWVQKNKEYVKEKNRAYRQNNLDKLRGTWREWYRRHSKQWQSYVSNRRACKLHRLPKSEILSPQEWECLQIAWNYKCAYCGIESLELTQDHVVPLGLGGEHTMENVIPACKPCNSAKCKLPVEEFLVSPFLERRLAYVRLLNS